jgi:hypothetical protein
MLRIKEPPDKKSSHESGMSILFILGRREFERQIADTSGDGVPSLSKCMNDRET